LGKQPLGQVSLISENDDQTSAPPVEKPVDQPKVQNEQSEKAKKSTPAPKPSKVTFADTSSPAFFRKNTEPNGQNNSFHRSSSEPALNKLVSSEIEYDTILGLN
jgi:hypothetical protein